MNECITCTLTDIQESTVHSTTHTYKQSYTANVSIEATIDLLRERFCALHHLLVAIFSRETKAKGEDSM